MAKRTQPYDTWQMDRLSHPGAAAAFLNAARADSLEMFLVALRKVAQAHQMSWVAKEANVKRETLYRSLSQDGNPTIITLSSVLDALDLDFNVSPKRKPASPDPRSREHLSKDDNEGLPPCIETAVVDIGAYKAFGGIGQNDERGMDSKPLGAFGSSLPKRNQQQQLEMVNAL